MTWIWAYETFLLHSMVLSSSHWNLIHTVKRYSCCRRKENVSPITSAVRNSCKTFNQQLSQFALIDKPYFILTSVSHWALCNACVWIKLFYLQRCAPWPSSIGLALECPVAEKVGNLKGENGRPSWAILMYTNYLSDAAFTLEKHRVEIILAKEKF